MIPKITADRKRLIVILRLSVDISLGPQYRDNMRFEVNKILSYFPKCSLGAICVLEPLGEAVGTASPGPHPDLPTNLSLGQSRSLPEK